MKKHHIFTLVFAVAMLGAGCRAETTSMSPETPPAPVGSATAPVSAHGEPEVVLQTIASGLEVPWSMVFTGTNRILVSERPGLVRAIVDGKLQTEPLYIFSETVAKGESGLMSMVLDPDYQNSQYIYACVAYEQSGMKVKVVRLMDSGNALTEQKDLLSGITAASNHAGCRLVIGPDKKLYVSTGDASNRALAQDLKNLGGKILRMNLDGSVPEDNPSNTYVWSYGHRNAQGLSFDVQGRLYSSEHGPSGFDGPGGGDEINLIVKGGNYGWPLVSHTAKRDGTVAPLSVYTPAVAPASLLAYTGDIFPAWKGQLFFGGLRGTGLYRVKLNAAGDAVETTVKLPGVDVGRVRDVVQGPDGYIYITTSNRDGRGTPRSSDDKIIKILPK
ncbi:MAG TPA: PQQ-dependent sugar dehydrogenase [Patescibacteria group bacterium]|nr:PQQ-dependent sugar dehydrogenase [Patescibacteria group bacterium]